MQVFLEKVKLVQFREKLFENLRTNIGSGILYWFDPSRRRRSNQIYKPLNLYINIKQVVEF